MDRTLIFAIYGAILGTLGFVLSLYLAFKERGKDKRLVKIILERLDFSGHYQLRIVNINFRKVTIINIGADLYVKKYLLWKFAENIPTGSLLDPPYRDQALFVISDGDFVVFKFQGSMIKYFKDKNCKVEIFVDDAEGNQYKINKVRIFNEKFNRFISSR